MFVYLYQHNNKDIQKMGPIKILQQTEAEMILGVLTNPHTLITGKCVLDHYRDTDSHQLEIEIEIPNMFVVVEVMYTQFNERDYFEELEMFYLDEGDDRVKVALTSEQEQQVIDSVIEF